MKNYTMARTKLDLKLCTTSSYIKLQKGRFASTLTQEAETEHMESTCDACDYSSMAAPGVLDLVRV